MAAAGKRFARALVEATGGIPTAAILEEIESLSTAMADSPSLRKVLENPAIPMAQKGDLVGHLQREAGLSAEVSRLLLLVVQRRRLADFPQIVAAYRDLLDGDQGILRGRVLSARPLDPGAVGELQRRLSAALGRGVSLDTKVSEDLVGGIQLRVGSTVYDGSVSGALTALCGSLAKG